MEEKLVCVDCLNVYEWEYAVIVRPKDYAGHFHAEGFMCPGCGHEIMVTSKRECHKEECNIELK